MPGVKIVSQAVLALEDHNSSSIRHRHATLAHGGAKVQSKQTFGNFH